MKFGEKSNLKKYVKSHKTTQKGSKNAKDSKRLKMLEKEALDVSNIAGFDHENQIVGEEQKIKKEIKNEVKIEPVDENFDEGSKNDKVEPMEENVHKG